MFIYVTYKDAPELSTRHSVIEVVDTSVEKSLLVNPDCPVRIMLEYIRKKCHLGTYTRFDLCDETGKLMELFVLKTYEYATERFEHKKIYYVIVLKLEFDKQITVLPQLNQANKLYSELHLKVANFLSNTKYTIGGVVSTKSIVTIPTKMSPPLKEASVRGKKKTRV